VEGMKTIHLCDLFYQVVFNTIVPLPETSSGNKYFFVVIHHYSKWCEARIVREHDIVIIASFFEDEIICQFGMPNTFSQITAMSGSRSLMLCVKIMVLYINLPHQHSHNAMVW
jgi:hypothetical protein